MAGGEPLAANETLPTAEPAPTALAEGEMAAPSGPGFSETAPPKPEKARWSWRMWAVVGLTVVIVVGFVGYSVLGEAGAKRTVLLKSGTGIEIPAGTYYSASLSLSKGGTISGSVASTSGVVLYVMDSSQYSAFQSTAQATDVHWTSGVIHNMTFQAVIGGGSWEVVFAAPNPYLPTQFLVTSDLVATS